jgi:isoleucyl-tRNA synthetase
MNSLISLALVSLIFVVYLIFPFLCTLLLFSRFCDPQPPTDVVDKHSADALRLYLINSPVVRAEPLKFKEDGVKGVVKDVFLPWFHAFRFFNQSVGRWERNTGFRFLPSPAAAAASENVMDRWIVGSLSDLVAFVHAEMKAYRLYTVVPRLVEFIKQLTNWCVGC